MLAPGDRLPALALPAADGEEHILSAPGRTSLVVVLVHDAACSRCRERLLALGDDTDAIRHEDGRVVAVAADRSDAKGLAEALPLPFPVLADEAGRLRARFGLSPGRALSAVADRFGEVWEVAEGACLGDLPGPARLETALRHIALQCPECGFADSPVGPFAP